MLDEDGLVKTYPGLTHRVEGEGPSQSSMIARTGVAGIDNAVGRPQ